MPCTTTPAAFCNWLSQEDGLAPDDWCYLPGATAGAMVLAPNYLARRGYRLPNLGEWEYAARAGTTCDRYFGRSLRHAAAYAWSIHNTDNQAEAVGRKRPNDLGLFDILGNLIEWCDNLRPDARRPLQLPGHDRRVSQGPAGFHPGRRPPSPKAA